MHTLGIFVVAGRMLWAVFGGSDSWVQWVVQV